VLLDNGSMQCFMFDVKLVLLLRLTGSTGTQITFKFRLQRQSEPHGDHASDGTLVLMMDWNIGNLKGTNLQVVGSSTNGHTTVA
jgi:hypothetical protein